MTILQKIVNHKHIEVQKRRESKSLDSLKQQLAVLDPNRSLRKRMDENSDFHLICEIKKASPSKGLIQPDFDLRKYASSYKKGGAAAISILTDSKFFQGNLKYINSVKEIVDLPILRKDFIIDAYQIYESKLHGADVILLIARILSKKQLNEFIDEAAKLNLDVLVEFADKSEIKKFSNTRDNVILGINNRNLDTFEVNFQKSHDLKSKLPKEIPIIAESGIRNEQDCAQLKKWGFHGALIGETLMRASNPENKVRSFISEVNRVDTT